MPYEVRHAIDEARRKGIEVLVGERYSAADLDAIAAELGVTFPPDYRQLVIEVGALSFRKANVHYFSYGKPSPATLAAGMQHDLLETGRLFRASKLPFSADTVPCAVAAVAAKLDFDEGHLELTLVDANGAYRTYFEGGEISEPRSLVDVGGIFPFFLTMFRDVGSRRTADELLRGSTP